MPTLHLVVDKTPPPVRRLLGDACAAQGLGYREVLAGSVSPETGPLSPGELLFCPAGSGRALMLERQLFQPGVATFHEDALRGPFAGVLDPVGLFPRLGLPTPRSVWVRSEGREELAQWVDHLGGFPVILKVEGGEGGVGVMRFHDLDTVHAVAQALRSQGIQPRLITYVPDAMHWRLVVVGREVVAAYRNPLGPDGVRSQPSGDREDHGLTPPHAMAELAVQATAASGTFFAGVDVLVHPSGRLYLLEANSPCYFPSAQPFDDSPDVAGAMVRWLATEGVARAEQARSG